MIALGLSWASDWFNYKTSSFASISSFNESGRLARVRSLDDPRRGIFALMVAGFVAASTSTCVTAAEAPKSYRIAGIIALSGPFGAIGEDMRKGVELALDERDRKVGGVPIEITWEDSETKAQVAIQKASREIAKGVDLIFGEINSGVTSALQSVTEQRKVPQLITFSADDTLTRPGIRYSFRTGDNTAAVVSAVITYFKANKLNKLYGVIPDYGAARDSWTLIKKRATDAGIEIAGEEFPALGNRDFGTILNNISNSGAQVAYTNVNGSDAITLLKQAAGVKLAAKVKLIGSGLIDETLVKALGPASVGVASFARYNWTADNPTNRAFVAAYQKKYGELPSGNAGEAYDSIRWWLNVVEGTHSWDKEDWVKAFQGNVNTTSIEGIKEMGACDHQARQPGVFVEAVAEGEGDQRKYSLKVVNHFTANELYKKCP